MGTARAGLTVRIVVSGTHATGKSTLVSDLAAALPGYEQLPDPFELVDDDVEPAGAESFVAQLHLAAERLVELPAGAHVVAERGPLDLLAYLMALADLGRATVTPATFAVLQELAAAAMAHVDLLVVLPLSPDDGIRVPADEDPELRDAMDARLLELLDDDQLVRPVTRVVELTGTPGQRLTALLGAIGSGS
ncbi:MAG: AAA family ATPase [Ornithinibacter sp.]